MNCSWLFLVFALCVLPKLCKSKEGCDDKARGLGQTIKMFLQCCINHAVPVQVCMNCHQPFTKMADTYTDFMANEQCKKNYTNVDRFNVIQSTYIKAASIWDEGICSDCFTNGTVTDSVSKILEIAENLESCMKANQKFCEFCSAGYQNLNIYYNEYVQKHKRGVCFDLQDRMNRTRSRWSEGCCPRKASLTIFFSTISVAFLLPIVFYGTSVGIYRRSRDHSILIDEDNEQNNEEEAIANTWAATSSQFNLARSASTNLLDEIVVREQPGPSSTTESNSVTGKDIRLNKAVTDDDVSLLQL